MFEKYLNATQRGIAVMVVGIILLLHTLGLFVGILFYALILISLAMIASGFMQAGLDKKVMDMINKRKSK